MQRAWLALVAVAFLGCDNPFDNSIGSSQSGPHALPAPEGPAVLNCVNPSQEDTEPSDRASAPQGEDPGEPDAGVCPEPTPGEGAAGDPTEPDPGMPAPEPSEQQ